MNTHNIELPQLPRGHYAPAIAGRYFYEDEMQAYATTAIEADRQARGGPVASANPVLHAQILTLRKYQAWRTGEDERTMDEAGIVPREITAALNAVIEVAEHHLRDATKKVEPLKYEGPDLLEALQAVVDAAGPDAGPAIGMTLAAIAKATNHD